jgi:UDP-glucose 6-dehydrogenase
MPPGRGLAHLGHEVRCSDRDAARVELLSSGEAPILEEGLEDLIKTGLAWGHLAFRTDNTWAIEGAEFTILRVPTPEGPDGCPDMSFIETVAIEVGPHLADESIVVDKSTVPGRIGRRRGESAQSKRRPGCLQSGVPQGGLGGARLFASRPNPQLLT